MVVASLNQGLVSEGRQAAAHLSVWEVRLNASSFPDLLDTQKNSSFFIPCQAWNGKCGTTKENKRGPRKGAGAQRDVEDHFLCGGWCRDTRLGN